MSMQHDTLMPQFTQGDRIALALRASGHSVQETARYFGVSRNTVGNWIANRRNVPTLELRTLAAYTGVTVEWLKTGKEPDPDGGPGSALPHLDSNQEPCDFPSHTYLPRAA